MSVGQRETVEELEARFRAAKDVVEPSHCQVVWLLAKGHSSAEVAEIVALSPRWVNKLARRYQAEGADALGDRRRDPGMPRSRCGGGAGMVSCWLPEMVQEAEPPAPPTRLDR